MTKDKKPPAADQATADDPVVESDAASKQPPERIIDRVAGMTEGAKWVVLVEFEASLNDANGKAVFPQRASQIVEMLHQLIAQGGKAVVIYGTTIAVDKFLAFRAQ